jgi:hypothetical protein
MKQMIPFVLSIAALSFAAAEPPPGAIAAWDPANSTPHGDSVAILDAVGGNDLRLGPNSGFSIVEIVGDPMGWRKKVLKFKGEHGGQVQSSARLKVEADWCIRLRAMPLAGGEEAQTLLDMLYIELRYGVSREQLTLIVYPSVSDGMRPMSVSVNLPVDQWSEVVASLKGRELTLRVGEEKATWEVPDSFPIGPSELPFRLGSRGQEGGRPFTGMMSDISFGVPE